MYAAIKQIVPDAAFSIFTGDIVDHAVWDTSKEKNTFDIADAYGRMAGAGMLVYGTAGNHESSPTNSYPPTTDDGINGSQWLYDLLSSAWSRWIGPRGEATAKEFGAYSTTYDSSAGRLRVISISTNMYYAQNYWLYEEPMQKDPSGQLAWLVGELDVAERAGERVYIIGHMPMGSRDAFHDGSNYFDQIIYRYSGTIAAMFFGMNLLFLLFLIESWQAYFKGERKNTKELYRSRLTSEPGHTHLDEFEISYADYGNKFHASALVASYIAPSMTPTSGHPAFRVYSVDPVTYGVLDATTYIANTSDPAFATRGPVWTKYYSAKEAYGPLVGNQDEHEELTPAFWHNVTEVFEQNKTAFGEHISRKGRGWAIGTCEDECRSAEICKMRAARAQDNCIPPDHIRVSSVQGFKEHRDQECEGSIMRDTLGSLTTGLDMLMAFEKIIAEKGGRERSELPIAFQGLWGLRVSNFPSVEKDR